MAADAPKLWFMMNYIEFDPVKYGIGMPFSKWPSFSNMAIIYTYIDSIAVISIQSKKKRREVQTIVCGRLGENCAKLSEFFLEYAAYIPQSLSTEIKSDATNLY